MKNIFEKFTNFYKLKNILMKKEIFNLGTSEFIELIKLLKIQQVAQTGGHAKMIVEDGLINVNGVQELRKRRKLRVGDVVEFEGGSIEIVT